MLRRLVWKEAMDLLRDPRILFGMVVLPLIVFGAMGGLTRFMVQQASQEASPSNMLLGVVDMDRTSYSAGLIGYLDNVSAGVQLLQPAPPRVLVEEALENGLAGVIVIPEGFGENITTGVQARVEVYTYLRELSMAETGRLSSLQAVVEGYSRILQAMEAAKLNVTPDYLLSPVRVDFTAYAGAESFTSAQAQALTGILFTLVYAPLLVVGYAASISATAIAVEKEEHTLEVLLTLPIPRRYIVTAKLAGGIIVSLLASASTMTGFYIYATSMAAGMGGSTGPTRELGLGLPVDPAMLASLVASMVSAILAMTLMAMILGSLGRDVRSGQSMAGFLWLLVFIVGYLLAAINLTSLQPSLQYLLASLPTAAPVITVKLMYTGGQTLIILSTIAQFAWTIVFYRVFEKILESEFLITGWRPPRWVVRKTKQ